MFQQSKVSRRVSLALLALAGVLVACALAAGLACLSQAEDLARTRDALASLGAAPGEGQSAALCAQMAGELERARAQSLALALGLGGAAAGAVLLAALLSRALGRSVARPLEELGELMALAGEAGQIDFSEEDRALLDWYAGRGDEIGRLAGTFRALTGRLRLVSDELEKLAGGDLRADAGLLSARDRMGQALRTVAESLGALVESIGVAAAQLNAGAGIIAGDAQVLAKNAEGQLPAVQRVGATLAQSGGEGEANAKALQQALGDARAIQAVAAKGGRRMQEMMSAAQDVRAISHRVSRAIRAIDDIALQTNILALDAAMEAARAGPGGTGIAVVASQSRDLAARSAQAAREAGDILGAFIKQADLEMGAALQATGAYSEILDNAFHVCGALEEAAARAQKNARAAHRAGDAMEQAGGALQLAAAAGRQCATTSEQMRRQAHLLGGLAARFRPARAAARKTANGPGYAPRPSRVTPKKPGGKLIYF